MDRARWPLLLFVACLALTVVLWATRGWIWLGVAPINAERSPFSDAEIHLATAVNCADGLGEWHGSACFVPNIDAVPRAQTYEPWLTFHRLGVDSYTNLYAITIAMLVLFYLAMSLGFRPKTWRETLLVLVMFFTAGVQLAVERANFDLLIATLLCLSGVLLSRPTGTSTLAGIATLSFATMLKLYTGLSCAFAWLAARTNWRWTLASSVAALALAVLVVGPQELQVLGRGAPEGGTRFSTGAHWLFRQAGAAWGSAAIVIAVIGTCLAWRTLRNHPLPAFERWPRRLAVFRIAFLTAIPLFLLKDSYDYRLTLWLPCLMLPFAWLGDLEVARSWRHFACLMIALFVFVAGIELPSTWLDSLAASSPSQWFANVATALSYLKQFAAWLLAALLTLLFGVTLPSVNGKSVIASAPQDTRSISS